MAHAVDTDAAVVGGSTVVPTRCGRCGRGRRPGAATRRDGGGDGSAAQWRQRRRCRGRARDGRGCRGQRAGDAESVGGTIEMCHAGWSGWPLGFRGVLGLLGLLDLLGHNLVFSVNSVN